ncbi:Neurotactin, partial [Folsomia candida]
MVNPSSHKGNMRSPLFLKFFALAICILAGILIIQVVILVRNAAFGGAILRRTVIEGNFATTITSCGFVKGLVVNESYAFLGIQYALPPLGGRRWNKAEVHEDLRHCWNGTYLAVERRKRCWQFYRNGSYDGAEDCLYLDIFTPKLDYSSPLDVIVFLGGDSLNGGESMELQPSPELAKERNAVFVSVSIRRSVLGFLSLKALSEGSPLNSSGNYGISDLLAALLYIQRNVRHFGGNPESVTVFGHQSGATILGALLRTNYASSLSSPLFHKVWMSGGQFREPVTLDQAYDENLKFFEYSECDSVDCLFKLSPEEILEGVPYSWRQFHNEFGHSFEERYKHYWLIYDGHILKSQDTEYDKMHDELSIKTSTPFIPVVVGAPLHVDTSSEMRSLLDWNSTAKYRKYLESSFDPHVAHEIYRQYNRPDSNYWQQFSAVLSDYHTICPMLHFSQTYLSKNLVFNYLISHKGKGGLAQPGSDIQAIFNLRTITRSPKDIKFKENMISLFYSFVKTGKFHDTSGATSKILMVDDRVGHVQDYSHCNFWTNYSENHSKNYSQKSNSTITATTTSTTTTTMSTLIEEFEESNNTSTLIEEFEDLNNTSTLIEEFEDLNNTSTLIEKFEDLNNTSTLIEEFEERNNTTDVAN